MTVVDATTQQTLECVLLLHGERPPEVTCRTLLCYIAVQVADVPHHDPHGSSLHPLYHVESIQGKLPLIFHFTKPGTVCTIQMSVHSKIDSEGVKYMHPDSEDYTCTVQIINRVARMPMKEPPLLRYTGSLTGEQFHKIEKQFVKLYLSPDYNRFCIFPNY